MTTTTHTVCRTFSGHLTAVFTLDNGQTIEGWTSSFDLRDESAVTLRYHHVSGGGDLAGCDEDRALAAWREIANREIDLAAYDAPRSLGAES